jgi:hypothetical protein
MQALDLMRNRRLICIIVEQPTPLDATGGDMVDCAFEQHAELSCRNGAVTNLSRPQNQQDCQISRADPKVTPAPPKNRPLFPGVRVEEDNHEIHETHEIEAV